MARPPMKQEGHPAHNMPQPTDPRNGDQLPVQSNSTQQDSQMIAQILANYGAPHRDDDNDGD